MKLEIYAERCCDACGEVAHNHFDCPACKKEYAGTSIYSSVYEMELGEMLACEECGAEFKLVCKTTDCDDYEWVCTKIKGP
jgi:hypothetical protein